MVEMPLFLLMKTTNLVVVEAEVEVLDLAPI
jgi:hypothetical protein